MGDAFILRSGGNGMSYNSATVCVTAPTGCVITFYKNDIPIKSIDASYGHPDVDNNSRSWWYYFIKDNNYGSWVIEATANGEVGRKEVNITTNTLYQVDLYLPYYFIKDGSLTGANIVSVSKPRSVTTATLTTTAPPVTYGTENGIRMGWTSVGSNMSAGISYFPEKIDLGNYNKLKFDGIVAHEGTSPTMVVTRPSFRAVTSLGTYVDSDQVAYLAPFSGRAQGSYRETGSFSYSFGGEVTASTMVYLTIENGRSSNTYTFITADNLRLEQDL